jgi:hypothetical protein
LSSWNIPFPVIAGSNDFNLFARKHATNRRKAEGAGRTLKLFALEDWPGPFFWAVIKLGNNLIYCYQDSTPGINRA